MKQEQQAIDAQFEKKLKGAEVAQKMSVYLVLIPSCTNHLTRSAQSTLTNKSRLKLLHRREEHLQDLFAAARSSLLSLSDASENSGRYAQFLEGVITQALLMLLEPAITVHARRKDSDVIQKAVDGSKQAYKDISGKDVNIQIEESLSDDS